MPFSIERINGFDQEQFIEAFGWVFEDSPWVAERAWRGRPFESRHWMTDRMIAEVKAASTEEKLGLLRAHPDLGTRAKVSPSSAAEQAGAGLDRLTAPEHARLLELNNAYRERFGFPFLYAVKGSDKFAILKALERRLHSHPEAEFREALNQVYKIAAHRLETVVDY